MGYLNNADRKDGNAVVKHEKSGGPSCSRYLMEHYNLKRAADDDDGHGLNGS